MFCWFITLLLIFLAKYNIWSDLDIDFSSKFYIKSIASAVQSWLRFFADVNFSSCTLDIFNSALTVKRTTSEGESSASRSVDDWRCRRRWLLHVLWCEAYPPPPLLFFIPFSLAVYFCHFSFFPPHRAASLLPFSPFSLTPLPFSQPFFVSSYACPSLDVPFSFFPLSPFSRPFPSHSPPLLGPTL